MTTQYRCKAVVAGTGAGGAVAGAMLAEAGVDVILVEKGKHYRTEDHADILSGLSRMYLNGAVTTTLGWPPIPLPLGSAVGGTTIINSSTCFRTPEAKVASWNGPTSEELQPIFDEVERRINAHSVDIELLGGNWRVLKRGCDAIGVEIKPLKHNVKNCKARGRCQYGCQEGAKQGTDQTFIPSALKAGARLLTEHKVERVIMEGSKAVGLAGTSPDGPFEIRADVVVLSMGAMQTPAFLLGGKLANSSGRVGKGLCIHPAARVVAMTDEIVDGYIGLPQGAYVDHWKSRGVMLEGIFTPPGLLLASLPGVGAEFKELAADYRKMAAFGAMVDDTTTGCIRKGRFGHPFVAYYQMNQPDVESLRFAVARIAQIYFAAGSKRIFTACAKMPVLNNEDDLAKFEKVSVKPSDFEMLAFHPLGTCGMGADPKSSVVDFSLSSHDVPGLYIMDGSVIPSSLGVNPQVTIMTLAMRASRILAEKLH
jgi:choline dehydrogenase-like flavoprotein